MSAEARALKVVVNDERYISEAHIISSLGALYAAKSDYMLPVAILCDDYLDRSGRMLGKVRDDAIERHKAAAGCLPVTQEGE